MNCTFCGDAAMNGVPVIGDCEVDYTTCEHCRRVIPLDATRCYTRVDEADLDFCSMPGQNVKPME